jgi:hypothetical protein
VGEGMNEPLPAGARIISRPDAPPPRAFGEGLTHAEYLVKSVHPDAEITDILRDPNSSLGRKNPGSYHVQARRTAGIIPVDVRPIRGCRSTSSWTASGRRGWKSWKRGMK